MAQRILLTLQVEDADLVAKIEALRARLREIAKEMRANPGPERFRELAEEMAKGKRELAELNAKQRELNREFAAAKLPKDSLVALRLEYSRLSRQVAELSRAERESEFGQKLIKEAARIKKEIDGVEQSMGRFTGNVGNYKSALSGLGNVMAALGIGFSVGEIVNQNALLSDAVANVAKTTNLAIGEADKLRQSLEKVDTRTATLNLLKIAEIGGQLGIAGESIEEFTISVDKLNVALGDAFGGNVEELTRVIAGVRNSLADFRTDDAASDMLRLGNALNYLESQGSATAPVIADFVSRLSGVAGPLGVTSDKIFGLSTALAELNVTPERGATAVSRLLQEIAKAPEAFAKSLGFSGERLSEFVQTANTDLVAALALVSKALAEGGDGSKNFAQTLDELGIGQAGAIEALGKLGQNTELLTTRIQQSAQALQGTDSILDEFDKKNNNAAASVEKLQKAFLQFITGEDAQRAIAVVASALTDLIKALEATVGLVFDNAEEFGTLTGVLFAFSKPGQIASEALRNVAIASQTATVATARQTIATQASTVATRALAAAQAALPLLAVIAGIYAIVKAFEAYNDGLSASAKATKAVEEAQKSIAESSAAEIASLERSIVTLQSVTATQQERAKAIEELNSKYPEYLQGINLEIQSAEALAKIQKELTEEIIRSAAARAKARAQEEITAKIVEQRLKIAQEEKAAAEGRRTFFRTNAEIIESEKEKLRELEQQLEETGKKFDETFGLNKPRKTQVIEIVDPKSLKQQADVATTQTKKATTQLSEEEKKAREKAAEERKKRQAEEEKRQEAQAKRILEIQRNLRELSISEESKYQQQLAELEAKRLRALEDNQQRVEALRKSIEERTGKRISASTAEQLRKLPDAKPADITEAELIEQENEAIQRAFDKQRKAIEQERQRALELREQTLKSQLLEIAKIEADNEQAAAQAALEELKKQFDGRRKEVEKEVEKRKREAKALAASGKITTEEREQIDAEADALAAARRIQIEQEYAARAAEIAEQLKQVRIAAAKAELDVQLDAIKQRERASIEAAQAEQQETGVDGAEKIAAIRAKAAAEAIAAEQAFANAVKEAALDAQQTQLDAIAAVEAAQQAAHEAELERIEEQKERRQELKELALDVAGDLSSKLLEISRNNLQNETAERLKAIDDEYELKKKRAGQNQKAVERLEKEQAKKKEEIEREAAEKRKQIAIIEAIINTAIAVARVAYNPILAAATAALGAVQIAVIKSQRFAKGGLVSKRMQDVAYYTLEEWQRMPDVSQGGFTRAVGPADETGHRVAGRLTKSAAVVHEGEYVAPAWMVKQMPELFERMEQMRKARGAQGLEFHRFFGRKSYFDGGFATNTALKSLRALPLRVMQGGGFAAQAPIIISQPIQQQAQQVVQVSASAAFDEQQVNAIAERIASAAAAALRNSLAEGLNDANRRLERQAALERRRTI